MPIQRTRDAITPATDKTRLTAARWSALLATGLVGAILAAAGCGSSSYSMNGAGSGPYGGPHTAVTAAPAIPQGNGGDADADNNGQSSDGDGGV